MRNQPGEGSLCARKPRGFGPDYKCLSAVGVNVTTTFEHVCNAKYNKPENIQRNMVLVLHVFSAYVRHQAFK
eukprot:1586360-Ditylum_brightwellii.AAC.1